MFRYQPAGELLEARLLLAAGALDATFGAGGIVTSTPPGSVAAVAEAIQGDGKIVVVGENAGRSVLARYTKDGSLETAFGNGGLVSGSLGTANLGAGLALQSDTKIVVAVGSGGAGGSFAVNRYNADGTLDTGFGNAGTAFIAALPNSEATALAVQTDGKIVVAGDTLGTNGSIDIVRLNGDGTPDPTFGSNGIKTVALEFGSSFHVVSGVVLQPNGEAVICGSQGDFNTLNFLMRFNTGGQLDASFGNGGKVFPLGPGAGDNRFNALALQPDGKIVAGGGANDFLNDFSGQTFNASFWIVGRFNVDGSRDTSFGTNGFVTRTFGTTSDRTPNTVNGLALQPDGKIVAAGNTTVNGSTVFALARFNPDGSLDPLFGSGGKVTTAIGSSSSGQSIINAGNGLKVAGVADGKLALARYLNGLPPSLQPNQKIFVTGADAGGGPDVKVFDAATLQPLGNFFAFDPNFMGGVRVAVGDVNGDTIADILAAAGPGGGPNIIVYSGKDGTQLLNFFAFDSHFTGGVFVAAGDVNGDGRADIICGADRGGGPNVTVFGATPQAMSFFPYDPGFTGGVRVAAGDTDGDGKAEIITGAGAGGGPNVTIARLNGSTVQITDSFFAFNPAFTAGVYVGTGNIVPSVPGDEIIVGAGAGGGPNVSVFSGSLQFSTFFPYNPAFTGGVRVAGVDVTGDGRAEVISVPGPGGGPDVKISDGLGGQQLDEFFAYDPRFTGGLFVAGR